MFSLHWINKNIIALGLISLFSDISSEMITTLLPAFLLSLGGSAAALGLIEGIAESTVCFSKIGAGWYSDFLGKRKPFALLGYLLNAVGISFFITAGHWYQILIGRLITRLGKGIRTPARDAWLIESTIPTCYGKVFGFHRTLDAIGACIGPTCVLLFLKFISIRVVFFIALLPTIIALLIIIFFTKESYTTHQKRPFSLSFQMMPYHFKLFLLATGIFSLGKITTSLFLLRITESLTRSTAPAFNVLTITIMLYICYNITYSLCALPIGYLADRFGSANVLLLGYLLMSISLLSFMFDTHAIIPLAFLFVIQGIAIATIDALERSTAAALLPPGIHGTGYGILSALQGMGNLASNTIVGMLWSSFSPAIGFCYSGILCLIGTLCLYFFIRVTKSPYPLSF